MDENPEAIEGFGRGMVRGMRFISDPANEDAALAHMAAGNPTEGEDRDFAAALLIAATERMTPTDAYMRQGFGYQPPEHWATWQESLLSAGDLEAPFDDLAAGYSNDWIEGWNAE